MQTLNFNTKTKTVVVKNDNTILYNFDNVPTVKVAESFYEVIQETASPEGDKNRAPVARFPIAATNMLIEK